MDGRGTAWFVFLIFSVGISAVYCGKHVLEYYMTMTSDHIPGIPRFSITAHVDGLQHGRYTSDHRRAEPLIPSLGTLTEHLEKQTSFAERWEEYQKSKMAFLMQFLNKTAGHGHHHVHVYQRKYICELRDDGTFLGYHAFLFNGKEVIAFDKERETFVPITPEAAHLIPSWNQYLAGVKANKFYLENVCIKHLQLYLSYISTVLERKVPPKVKISVSISDRGKLLCCLVYGFHPKKVHVKVIKNGTEEVPPEELKHVLPNPDGTYQIRVSVRVTPGDGATYSCHVDHSSLENPLVVPFEPRENLYTIISFATAVVVLVVLGVFICRKKKDSGNTKQDNTHCPPCLKSSSSECQSLNLEDG
ncbi:zinc-alpha-2-glycoprotein-like [Xenopus laevis]|uniref:Zinc-alpha-2-glycoprotein-like n=1 Tax=Xenopus laevis TaxID=8355 RepID=A0A8J1LP79_XENLA|nr:zinc-alpha-2-glycoprotein-like [Xenopus laevis]